MLHHRMFATAPAAAPLAPVRLAVIEADGAWRLYMNGERLGRFADRAEAVACANEVAVETRREGHLVEVLTQSRFGELVVDADRRSKPPARAQEGASC